MKYHTYKNKIQAVCSLVESKTEVNAQRNILNLYKEIYDADLTDNEKFALIDELKNKRRSIKVDFDEDGELLEECYVQGVIWVSKIAY